MEENDADSLSSGELYSYNCFEAVDYRYDDPLSFSGISKAVIEDNLEKVKSLVNSGKSVNINDNNGNTPLHIAVLRDRLQIFEFLVAHEDTRIESKNFFGETSLFLAVVNKNFLMVKKLIAAGANVNTCNNEMVTPLHKAINSSDILVLLIKHGANINALDCFGESPLQEAINERNVDTVKLLLYYNADVNIPCDNGLTPFMKAIIIENHLIQEALLEHVIDFNAKTTEGMSVLRLALTHETPYLGEIINRGAKVNLVTPEVIDDLEFCLRVPITEKFQLLCENYFTHNSDLEASIIFRIIGSDLGNGQFLSFLKTVSYNENIRRIIYRVADNNNCNLGHLVNSFIERKLPYSELYEISTRFLSLGLDIGNNTPNIIFEYFGYCDLFKLLLHLNPPIKFPSVSITTLICDVDKSIDALFDMFIEILLSHTHLYEIRDDLLKILDYCINPKFNATCLTLFSDKPFFHDVLLKIRAAPSVPKLLDLARNKSRSYITQKFNITTCSHFYTVVNSLPLPKDYKDVITFERALYKD